MIKHEETSLTLAQYNAVRDNAGLFTTQILVQQRALEFAEHTTGQPLAGRLFDAAYDGTRIVKVYIDTSGNLISMTLASEVGGNQTWQTVGTLDTGVLAVRPSLAGGYVFYVKTDGVWRRDPINLGATPVLIIPATDALLVENGIGTDGYITHVAASDATNVVLACERADFNSNLIGAYYDTSWHTFQSDIYWPRSLDGMDAAPVPGGHVLVISSDLPPLIGQEAEGTKVRRVAERRNGLIAFRIQNHRFSDHFLVEAFDDASDFMYRTEPRLTQLSDVTPERLVLTAYGKDGKSAYNHAALHFYFSVDGRMWETDHLLSLDSTYLGACMVPMAPFTYLIGETKTFRAKTTELTGETHPDLVEDITHLVVGYSSDQSGARQSTIALKNTGWLPTSLLYKNIQLSLITKLGVWVDGVKALVPIAHELIDVITPSREKPTEQVLVKTRDFTALIAGNVRSPHSREYDTQVQGADKFYDFTGTGYGGLAHTAGASGTWSTADNWLRGRSNNQRSVAFNTFKSDGMWNGVIEGTIRIDTPDKVPENPEHNESIGFCIRAYDKKNYLAIEYVPQTDKLRLIKQADAKQTKLYDISMVTWGYDQDMYLRVVVRYSKIYVYTSANGKTWTEKFTYILPGKSLAPALPISGDAVLLYEDGLVGYTGLGYTVDDVWPDPPTPPPPSGGGDDEGTIYGSGTKSGLIALQVYNDWGWGDTKWFGYVAYTRSAATGPWYPLVGGIATFGGNGVDIGRIAGCHLDPYDFGAAYLFMENGDCYYNPDWRNGANWELFISAATLQTAMFNANGVGFSKVLSGVVTMAASGYCLLTVVGDESLPGTKFPALIRLRRLQSGIDVSPLYRLNVGNYTSSGFQTAFGNLGTRNANFVMASGETSTHREYHGVWACDWTCQGSDQSCFSKFFDAGWNRWYWAPSASWARQGGSLTHTSIFSPYKRLDGSDNTDDLHIYLAGPGGRIWESEDGGDNFNAFTAPAVGPNVARAGAPFDSWEINTTEGGWIHYINGKELWSSPDGGVTWKSVQCPETREGWGWCGGFPSAQGKFYLGSNRYSQYAIAETGTPILMYTQDGGQSWVNWTHNLYAVLAPMFPNRPVGVVRFTPHPTE